ncbi:MAG: Amidase [Ilumatobacteraceae bacterium]|nr:Amidase [Ilumatobacteraceae bacterium]
MSNELWRCSAVELAGRLARGDVSAREVLDVHLQRIEQINPSVNAVITMSVDRAIDDATRADDAHARGESLGRLHGLPVAHKDLATTAGIRTTMGSPIFADHVPVQDELLVARMRAAGCVTVGKTNTPEFGAGSHTFNTLFGATRNPYDVSRSAGGSSGGAAAALAAGMVPLADGSDLGGSLRNPASFCNVIGLRTTPGTVPAWPSDDPWDPSATDGPMGRCAADVALLLGVISGSHPNVPLRGASGPFEPLERSLAGLRVAWDPTAGGLPMEPVVRIALADVPSRFVLHGCSVDDAYPDLRNASSTFQTLRAVAFERGLGGLYDHHYGDLKDTIRWNIELARSLSAADVGRALRERGVLQQRVRDFFERFDVLALPTVQVVPFAVELDWLHEIDGVPMDNYLQWMRSCTDITVTGCPAISVPAGFTPDGLPVGLQLVAAPGNDLLLLQVAHAFDTDGFVARRWPDH